MRCLLCLLCVAALVGASAPFPPGWERAITKVHLVFMTHLDVGYTEPLVSQVLDQYSTQWFAKAINTSATLEARGGPERFKWTSHAWLLRQMLDNSTGSVTPQALSSLQDAIARGWIQWHALPFNLQAEVSDASLYEYGVSVAHQLDQQFNKTRKVAASQKDVPGQTLGIVDLLAKQGVQYLNVGVNDFSVPPALADGTSIAKCELRRGQRVGQCGG